MPSAKDSKNISMVSIKLAPNLSHYRILCVDDSKINQKVAQFMLQKMGYTVDIAANGKDAIESICSFPYDLVLMDIQMPEMDGLEATKAIRSLPQDSYGTRNEIPIIGLSGISRKGIHEICLKAGMSDFLTKPIRKERLLEAIKRHLRIGP